ncbi:MAG: GIY-YIG nuclease family protein [Minisyncoccia bacterium]
MYYTYILQSNKDKKFYTGATNDLRKRLLEHNQNEVRSTKNRGPFEIIYYEACKNMNDAFDREKYLKSGHGKRYIKDRLRRSLFPTGQVKKGVHPVESKSSRTTQTFDGGFVALISVVIISAVLMLVALTLSTTSFSERYNVLASEFKERSSGNAEACVDEGLLMIANGNGSTGTSTVNLTLDDFCELGPVPQSGDPRIFYTKANFRNYVTNLKISVNPVTLNVISWEEIGTY